MKMAIKTQQIFYFNSLAVEKPVGPYSLLAGKQVFTCPCENP